MPRVTVIMPAYNAATHLPAAIRSIEKQTYHDWEVVIADDGSTDDTFAVASSFGGRVRAVRNERNAGPAGARNLAIARSDSELVAMLDSDDMWLPHYLDRQVDRYDTERARGRRIGIVACDARVMGERSDRKFLDHFRGRIEPVTLERVLKGNCIFISALVSREAGDDAGWFAPELFGTEDHDLWIRILEQGREVVLNHDVLALYRQPPGSVSSNLARMAANNQRTYERALARGRLTPSQRRIARSQLRYNRAMEAVAAARFGGEPAQMARMLPTLLSVALTHPRSWPDWVRVVTER